MLDAILISLGPAPGIGEKFRIRRDLEKRYSQILSTEWGSFPHFGAYFASLGFRNGIRNAAIQQLGDCKTLQLDREVLSFSHVKQETTLI